MWVYREAAVNKPTPTWLKIYNRVLKTGFCSFILYSTHLLLRTSGFYIKIGTFIEVTLLIVEYLLERLIHGKPQYEVKYEIKYKIVYKRKRSRKKPVFFIIKVPYRGESLYKNVRTKIEIKISTTRLWVIKTLIKPTTTVELSLDRTHSYLLYKELVIKNNPFLVGFRKTQLIFDDTLHMSLSVLFTLQTSHTASNRYNYRESTFVNSKIRQIENKKFYNNKEVKKKNINFYENLVLGVKSMWTHLRYWLIPLNLLFFFSYFSFVLRSLPLTRLFFGYFLLIGTFYLLISGFVFFFKKYQYRLYTSAIQRFWRRTLNLFWLIEASLFIVFIYLIFNASQEPVHQFDNLQVHKTHFYSWRYFLIKIIISALLVICTYMLVLSAKWNIFTKHNNLVFITTVLLLYLAWMEFYQLIHVTNGYSIAHWCYDFTEHLWELELEFKRTRIVNHFVTIGLIAKFWHVIFAVVFWIFFILRGLESTQYRYPLLSANLQNFIIIYIMSWLYMYPWIKYMLRQILDMPYFWFFLNNRKLCVFLFFNDIYLYFYGLSVLPLDVFKHNVFGYYTSMNSPKFYYFYESAAPLEYSQFRNHSIRDVFLNSLCTPSGL